MGFTYQANWEAPPFFDSAEDPFSNFKTDGSGHQTDVSLKEQQAWCQVDDYSPMPVLGTPGPYTPFSPADSSTTSEEGSDYNASYPEHDQALSSLPYGPTPDITRCNSVFTNFAGSSSAWSAPSVHNISYTAHNHQMATMAAIALEPKFMNASYEQDDQLDFMNYTEQTSPEAQNSMMESRTYPQTLTYSNKTSTRTEDDDDDDDEDSSFPTSAFETSVDDANDPDYSPSKRPITAIKRTSYSAKPTTRGQHVLSPRSTGITKSKHIPRRTPRISLDNPRTTYPCVFRWAGCQSDFSAKNEWKRHVSTQHLGLQYWQCRLGTCGEEKKGKDGKTVKKCKNDSHVFNRKDLFTQHIRRQHVPVALKSIAARKGKDGSVEEKERLEAWEKKAQCDALFLRRQPLNDSTCPIRGCKHTFTGRKGWDDRMEHLGKHAEKGECSGQDLDTGGLREWALKTGVLDHFNGDWRFLDDNADVMSWVEDAEGEDE